MDICQNLNNILKERKITQKELCQHISIAESKLSYWLTKSKSIPSEYIIPICEYLSVSPSFLLTGQERDLKNYIIISKEEIELIEKYRSLSDDGKTKVEDYMNKVFDTETSVEFYIPTKEIPHSEYKVSAGIGIEIGDYNRWENITVLRTREAAEADYCLTVKGDSMLPLYNNGDIILIKEQSVIEVGQIGVFNIDNNGYVKKYGKNKLISLNPEYDDIIIPSGDNRIIKCCGLVLGKAVLV